LRLIIWSNFIRKIINDFQISSSQREQVNLIYKKQIEDLRVNLVKLQNEKELIQNDLTLFKGKSEMTSSLIETLRSELSNSKMKISELERKQMNDLSTIESQISEINKLKFQIQSNSMSLIASQEAYQNLINQVNEIFAKKSNENILGFNKFLYDM